MRARLPAGLQKCLVAAAKRYPSRVARAVILQHVEFEGPARIGELLSDLGYALDVRALWFEVGWGPIRLQRGSPANLFRDLPEEAVVLHWHGDTFELSVGALHLASSVGLCEPSIPIGHLPVRVQFQCEARAEDVAAFIRTDADFVEQANGVSSLQRLREDTERQLGAARQVGDG